MSLCPLCGRTMCDHTPTEREQTIEQVERPLTEEEFEIYRTSRIGHPRVIKIAQKNRLLETVA
jgi:hypothetical protein